MRPNTNQPQVATGLDDKGWRRFQGLSNLPARQVFFRG
jgi:hypothetical protein